MSIDERFLIAIAIMASVAYSYRVAGLIIGTHLRDSIKLRRFLDVLPACAIGAVLGPALATMSFPQWLALLITTGVYLVKPRFLLALTSGTAVLLWEKWIVQLVG